MFAIRHKKTQELLKISTYSNEGGEFCNEVGARFDDCSDLFYIVSEQKIAEEALKENPEWYNSSNNRPEWPSNFNPADYEIVSLKVEWVYNKK